MNYTLISLAYILSVLCAFLCFTQAVFKFKHSSKVIEINIGKIVGILFLSVVWPFTVLVVLIEKFIDIVSKPIIKIKNPYYSKFPKGFKFDNRLTTEIPNYGDEHVDPKYLS